jgi:hypothetical protein
MENRGLAPNHVPDTLPGKEPHGAG